METQDDIHELTAGYALDALDADDLRRFEEHLRGCERCRAEVDELTETAGALAWAADASAPPDLRDRILAAARAESRAGVVPLAPRRRAASRFGLASAAAAVAAVVALGIGIWALSLERELSAERDAASDRERALAIVAAPGAERHTLSGAASGALVVAPDRSAALLVSDLPPAPAGRTYEAWVIVGERPRPAGLFDGGRTVAVPLEQPVPANAVVAVTVEREGGVDTPTGDPILSSG